MAASLRRLATTTTSERARIFLAHPRGCGRGCDLRSILGDAGASRNRAGLSSSRAVFSLYLPTSPCCASHDFNAPHARMALRAVRGTRDDSRRALCSFQSGRGRGHSLRLTRRKRCDQRPWRFRSARRNCPSARIEARVWGVPVKSVSPSIIPVATAVECSISECSLSSALRAAKFVAH